METQWIETQALNPRSWNPESTAVLTSIADSDLTPAIKRQKLIQFIRQQKPINQHILFQIPEEMSGIWSQQFINQFTHLFGNGAPAPDGFTEMTSRGTMNWSREKIEKAFMKQVRNNEHLKLIMKDRCKNSHRKLLFGPIKFQTMIKLFSWITVLIMIPERLVFDPKFRSCFDFAREWSDGDSPNSLIGYLRARIVGTSLLDIATACLAGEVGAGFDVVSAFRNILAAPEWWPFQILPVWMEDVQEIWWSLAPTVEFGKRNAASIWTAAYKTFFSYWDIKAGKRIAYLPINPCSQFGLKNRKIVPASVKWQDLTEHMQENPQISNARAGWVDSVVQLLGTPEYNDLFWKNIPGYDLRNHHPGSSVTAVVPFYRRCDDFNKVASEWRKGDDHIIARTTTIDDTLLFSSKMQPLKEAHLLFLEGHRDSHLGIDFAKTTQVPLTKVDMIGYEIDFKAKTLRVKSKKLLKYDKFWEEMKSYSRITVEMWAKIVGRLLFAASLSPWRLKDLESWIQPYRKLVRSIFDRVPSDWFEEKFWDRIRFRNIPMSVEMEKVATSIFQKAWTPVPALQLVLQPFDGPVGSVGMTDASNLAMGGTVIRDQPQPWSVTFEIRDGIQHIGAIPLPRRWERLAKKKALIKDPDHPDNAAITTIHIGAAEFLGTCVQLAILLKHDIDTASDKKLITMVGDNMSVAWALVKKKSQYYMPFLDWIESKLRPIGWNITSARVDTAIFPADVLSRPASEGIDWQSWNIKVQAMIEGDKLDHFSALREWRKIPNSLMEDAQQIAERTWFEIDVFARKRQVWRQ